MPVTSDRITQIFNTTITGGSVTWAAGAAVTQNVSMHDVRTGDAESLSEYLRAQGAEDTEVAELHEAIDADRAEGEGLGDRTKAWVGKVAFRLAMATGTVATETGAGVLAAAIAKYLNLI